MADRTMEELLQAPTEGDVPNDAIKLMLFSYSLEGAARVWACPHHGFSELTQIDTFYNGLTEQDQDSLNAAAGGNLLNKTTREALKIIENKSKVRYLRSFQKQPFSVPSNQIPPNVPNEFSNHMKSNEIMIKSMQNQINVLRGDFNKQEEKFRKNLNDDMRNILSSFFQNQPSALVTLPSNTVPNPKGEMKAVTTRSGLAYEGPSIPTESSLEKVDEQNTEEILDKEHSNSSRTKVPLNENCSAMLLKKLPEKLGDPADPRVPLILGRSFLRTGRALIDVYGEEITLRVNDESITFNFNQTMRYSSTYDDTSVNRVDVIDIACEEFVQDVLDFQYNPKSSSPTLVSDDLISENDSCKEPIVKSSSPTLTLFGESDFFLKEIKDFLNDDSIPTGIENFVL
nr:reverse transcriptase domain-containing protein [Tanacetum cinerariifolium]